MRDRVLRSRALITAVDWAAALMEVALLFAWKSGELAGAGRVLVAWVVISGLMGLSCVFAPIGRLPSPAYGHALLGLVGVAFSAALIWFDHGLLGAMALAGLLGAQIYRERCDAFAGRVHRHR